METYADDACPTDDWPDVGKVMPLLCSPDETFRRVEERIGDDAGLGCGD